VTIGAAADVTFAEGEALSASKLNALAQLARSAGNIVGDGTVVARRTPGGVVLSAPRGRDVWVPARITAAPDESTPIAHDAAVYSAAALFEATVAVTDAAPAYRNTGLRPGQTPAPLILPARVGDDCHLVIGPDPANPAQRRVRLAVWSEALQFCAQNQSVAAVAPSPTRENAASAASLAP
jgi:hypothetical protein